MQQFLAMAVSGNALAARSYPIDPNVKIEAEDALVVSENGPGPSKRPRSTTAPAHLVATSAGLYPTVTESHGRVRAGLVTVTRSLASDRDSMAAASG